jgi:hypothetical protein
MKRSRLLVLLGSLCAVSTALATTYVRVEKDGTKTYSDRPIPGGQPIDLQPAQTYSTPPAGVSGSSGVRAAEPAEADFRYESCPITPANDSNFMNPESVSITANTNPGLRGGDQLTMTVDGQPANGADARSHLMTPVDRGTHVVAVTVRSPTGAILCSSTASFHVQRPGLNSPARAQPRPGVRPGG